MIKIGVNRKRIFFLYVALTALIIGGGYSTFAQLKESAYTVQTVHVFPGQITSEGFENAETLTFQNLDEYALLQDFNAINSATLKENFVSERDDVIEAENQNTEFDAESQTDQDVIEIVSVTGTTTDSIDITNASTTNVTDADDEVVSTDESATSTLDTNEPAEESAQVDEAVADEPEQETAQVQDEVLATTTVSQLVGKKFALAIETLTETFSSTSATSTVEEDVIEEDVAVEESVDLDAPEVSFGFASTAANTVQLSQTELPSTTRTDAATHPFDNGSEENSATENATGSDAFSGVDDTDPVADQVEVDSPDLEAQSCEPNCSGYVLSLSGFDYPLDEGSELSGAQLRMSFAAKHKDTRELVPLFTVNYSLDGGSTWSTGGSIVIDDEVSNSVNGGYYLFALPAITDQSVLKDLQFELRYDDDPALVDELYVESVWLELFVLEPPENPVETPFNELLLDDGYTNSKLSGDVLELPDGEQIRFDFTDDNADETLIIKSNQKMYEGLSEAVTYFSVTNTNDQTDDFTVQTYFPKEVGEVKSLEVFNLNKEREVTIPEFRPYVYHCDAGWGVTGEVVVPESLTELSIETAIETGSTTVSEFEASSTSSQLVNNDVEMLQASSSISEGEFSCAKTNVVRTCDSLDGDGTACVVREEVAKHQVTNYAPGWEDVLVSRGELGRGGFLKRVGSFFGFGPSRKDIPEEFEGNTYSDSTFSIAPGETRYFKMEIMFPPFTSGEYWIEVVGDNEYGLLDPFWSSQWQYRMPLSIDNTSNAQTLTEHQVFLELDSSLTDFWTNVEENGNDIRFVQETTVGNEQDWYGTGWSSRRAITIQSSQVLENMTDFPVYVDLADLGSTFFSNVQAGGDDIRVTAADGLTEMPYELVTIDTGAETGELHFKADSVSSSTDTTFYIYHGNPNVNGYEVTDTYGAENVWGSDHIAVYHMEEAAAGRGNADLYQDSTSNEYDADDQLNSTGKSGKLGQGQEVDAQGDASEYILLPSDIVNGEAQLTFSYWMNSSDGANQALLNGGANNEYLFYLTGGGTNFQLFPGGSITVPDLTNSTWRHVLVTRNASGNQWEVYVDGQSEGTNSVTLNNLGIPADCLTVGLEQDGSCLSSGDTSQHLNASIDEMRFRNDIPTAGEVSAMYINQSTTTDFYSVGSVETFAVTSFSELDFWLQHFSTTTEEADIWVQVDTLPGNASTTIYLYYGSAGAISASDEYAPFTYSSARDLYYVVDPSQTSPIIVYSLIDGNEVSLDGAGTTTLDSGESASFSTYASTSVVSALGPVTSRTAGNAGEPLVPISFASTTHIVTTNRGNEDFNVYSPFNTASVDVFEGANGASSASGVVSAGAADSYNVDLANNTDFGIVESDEPILLFHNNDNDSYVVYPPTTRDLFGIYSQNYLYGSIAGGASVEVYCSSGNNGTTTGMTRGGEESNDHCGGGANTGQGLGNAIRLTNASDPIGATQEADGDGTESSRFIATPELGTRYILPQAADYVTVACIPRFGDADIEIQTAAGATVDTGTCSVSGEHPGALNFTPGSAYTQGYQVVSTNGAPFYIYYEDAGTGDETNTWSAVQARDYNSLDGQPYSFGAQEINIDAEYEQLAFRWYENTNAETPVTSWSLGDDGDATENDPIVGKGSVGSGDVLRLRINLQANVATGSASSTAFALQYAEASTCSTAGTWFEIGKVGSTTAAFSGYNNTAISDGLTLSSTTLSQSTVFGTYEEASLSEFIPNEIGVGEVAEWDWVITNSNANVNSTYCFRMVRSSGDALASYTEYPQLDTSGPPAAATLIERFDSEHATSVRPTLEFVASDPSGDDLHYYIEIDDDVSFGSPVLVQNSNTNFSQFVNTVLPSDKSPFNSGQVIRYTLPSDLVSSTTYWWRIRSLDPDGSNTFSVWSDPFSFTINESLAVSEWFQTTDEQFETNSLISATTSGSGSIEADIGGSPLVGEYGSLDVTVGATTTVSLNNSYTDPVVVTSIRYSRTITNGDQPITRVSGKTATSFDVLAHTFDFTSVGTATVDYVVVEAGEALIDDGGSGIRMFATSTSVGVISGANIPTDPGGIDIEFPTSFEGAPIVLAAVTTSNDPSWVAATVYDGNDIGNPPTASQVSLYLNDSLASDGHASAEDIDIIAFDVGSGVNDSVNFAYQITAADVSSTPVTKTFSNTYASTPGVILVQQLTMNGAQGGYGMIDIDTPPTNADVTVSADEGGTSGARSHASESMAIVSFESGGGDIIRSGAAQVVSATIDFDDADVGNAWGEISWNDAGDVAYKVQYQTGSGFADIPDSALPGNSSGFTSAPINILDLDTDTYNQIRILADLSGPSPEIYDWTVTWGLRVDIPTLGDPFDNEKVPTTTPTFDFYTTDPQGDALEYEISWSTDDTFASGSTTRNSSASSDFSVGHPYVSGANVTFTIPSGDALTDGQTYWWRVRAKDPSGSDSFSPWSDPDSFTVDTSTLVSTWFQTTKEQFEEGVLDGSLASSSNSIEISPEIGEYGTTTVTDNDWTTINTTLSYNNMVVVASPEYAFNGTNNGRTVQVRNKTSNSFEIKADNYTESLSGPTDVDYIVMEAGDWLITDGGSGARIIAGTVAGVSAVEGSGPGYTGGSLVDFSPDFTATPGALTTVSTANGSKWVATVIDDGTAAGEITADSMFVALGIGLDADTVREPEDIDYIAFEPGIGSNNGVLFDMFNTGSVVTESETESTITFNQTFSTAPGVIVVQNNGTNGTDGGFAQVDTDTAITNTEVDITIAEMGASAGNHAAEVVSVLVFEDEAGTIIRQSAGSGGLTGTAASEPILFSDGAGPKFERALFSTSSPGLSSTSVQVQYLTGTSSWNLIPDTQIPGNSTGLTNSPIDLTGVDVSTYAVIRLYATLQCDGTDCPSLDDWSIEWSEGVPVSGTIAQYDRSTPVTSGTVRIAVNGIPGNTGTIAGDGTWVINNVTAFDGDTVTVWVDGAAEQNEAVGVFIYDGIGDMTGLELYEQHLSLSADENSTTTNTLLSAYDYSVSGDEDIFFDVNASNDLIMCAVGVCSEANLYIGPGNIYVPDETSSGNVTAHDVVNDGTLTLDGNTLRVSGSWYNNATFNPDTSSVIFTATSTSETIDDADNLLDFGSLTFGETSGSAIWKTFDTLDVNGGLSVQYGTLDRASSTITVSGAVTTGVSGFWSGVATTTFDGTGSSVWSDTNPVLQNIGYVVVDGSPKTVILSSDVLASSVTIGTNDTLNGGGSNDLHVTGNFTNLGTFTPQTSTIVIDGVATDAFITAGASSLYGLTASSTNGSVSFLDSTVTLLGDMTIATGTVTLPVTSLIIGGSFSNTGGTFAHNNGLVRFTGAGSKTIELQGTEFLNSFYDVSFTGSGDWSFVDASATTSNTFTVTNGTVVLPSDQLTVARDFTTSGSGSFDANGGEVVLLISGNDQITTNGSQLHDVRIRQSGSAGTWYNEDWPYRIPVTIRASEIDDDLTNFPVYVDLSDLPAAFFANVSSDGGDIRVTESDAETEVAREVVNASTTTATGELYFNASSLSSTTDTVFYVYYGHATATDYAVTDTYGAENVWSNGYVLVAHMNDETSSTIVNSADGTLDGTKLGANNPAESATGQIYEAQDFSGDEHIGYGNLGSGASNITISAWFNPSSLTGAGDTGTYGHTIFSAHSSGNYTWLAVGGTGGGGSADEVRFCGFSSSATCNVASGSNISVGNWYYVSATAIDGGASAVRVNGSNVLSFISDGGGTWNSGSTIGDLRPNRDIEFEGILDEIQVSNVVRSVAWQDATYRNQGTTTDFYAVGSPQQDSVRTFASTNVSLSGDLVIESGQAVLPTGNLLIAGSLDNDSEFSNNGGTVQFTATTTQTIAAGDSSFYNLVIDGVGGDITVVEHATATNNINLVNANSFTVASGIVLETTASFSNQMQNASTTWTDATLRLSSASDIVLNSKSNEGDDYNILSVTNDAVVSMWNSVAASYDTQGSSAIYSQDHDGVDGDLYIYGTYVREGGTEYWSYLTDFDGQDLVASSSERQVNVRIANGASVIASSSVLLIEGVSTASTTIDSQSGTYSLVAQTATVTATYFDMSGSDADGFQLISSTTVTDFDNADFTISTSDALTVDASTVDTNPASQFFNTNFFAGGGNVNVDMVGTPTSFWWFREGVGDRYGEAFDNGDGNPGQIRWDDSNYQLTATGTVFSDAGITPLGGPTCDGFTPNVRVVVDGGAYTDTTSCDGGTGEFVFNNISYQGDATLVFYLDTNGGEQGSTITRTPTSDISDLNIYANRVIVRHEDAAPMTVARMALYDEDDDSDLRFSAATGTVSDTLVVRPDTELYVFASSTFTPTGTVTLESGGTANSYDGTLHLGGDSTFTGVGTTTYTIGGSIILESGASLETASSSIVLTATTTGKQIAGSAPIDFHELSFVGVGGEWSIDTDITAATDVLVSAGVVTGSSDITVDNGSLYGDGVVNMIGGTVQINDTNTLGGVNPWTFDRLTLGDGGTAGVTTPASNATTTVSTNLIISSGHFLDAGGSVWDLGGSGAVFTETGTFIEGTSTIQYSGIAPIVLRTTYYDLAIDTDAGGSVSAVGPTTGLQVLGDLHIGLMGTSSLNLTLNDPLTAIGGDVIIGSLGTLSASDSNDLEVYGNWNNDGTFASNNGSVLFQKATGTATVAAGDSSFANVTFGGSAFYTMTESATATNDVQLGTGLFTLQSGEALAVGGVFTNGMSNANTVWANTTLRLFGGQSYVVNTKLTGNTYNNIEISGGTHPRFWNATTTSVLAESGSSLYSMDHAGVDGDLYIFGDYINTGYADTWSYGEDFDGNALGVPRQVAVQIEDAGSVTYTGGSLTVLGTSSATTTIAAQGAGSYSLLLGGTTTVDMNYYSIREIDSAGLTLTATPIITDLSFGDFEPALGGASGITVGGTVIDANTAKNFTNNRFATTSAISANNVTATGTSVSSWRFVNVDGNLDGEQFDVDPGGDPGYVVWEDSAALITISGTVYSDEGVTPMNASMCNGTWQAVRIVVAGLTSTTTHCDAGTGNFSVSGISFGPSDSIVAYLTPAISQVGAVVTVDPISNIVDMDIYQDRVIVRNENVDPITIADMAVWDSSDDANIPFTAVDAGTDTLTLPADTKLIVWNNKDFKPTGNVTLSGGGAGAAYDGTLELYSGSTFDADAGEQHSIGGSLISGAGATFDADLSTTTFTTSGAARTIDTNESGFNNVVFNGTGSWTITDLEGDVNNDLLILSGAVTLPAATTTISGSFTNSGGSFVSSGGTLVFDAPTSGNDVTFGGSDAGTVIFNGVGGSWTISDTDATSTGSFSVASGTVTLPSGVLTVGNDFVINDTIAHSGGTVRLTGTGGGNVITLNNNDLTDLVIEADAGDYELTDVSATMFGSLTLVSGEFTVGSGTVAIGDSFDVSGGVFNHGSGTLLFNSSDAGEFIDSGSSDLYNVVISGAGGWTIVDHATTTNNFSILNASSFTLTTGSVLYVGGVFTNDVGGAATTWTNTTLVLDSGTEYEAGSKSAGVESYQIVVLGDDTDVSMWNSSAAVTTVPATASLYSQDHAGNDGDLYIFGDYHIATTTEYWSAETDFDGVPVAARPVTVAIASGGVVTVENTGSLQIVGVEGTATTSITNQGSGSYSWLVSGGSLNANYYDVQNIDTNGLQLAGSPSIASLSYGYFTQSENNQDMITLASTTLNANASLLVRDTGFAANGFTGGDNVVLDATTTNSWNFTGSIGDLWGENFDVDGINACGSVRWDDSDCLLVEQIGYRWRNDDGGEGAAPGTWYDGDWGKRQSLRIVNNDATAYASTAVKFTLPYDADMQADFDDIRVTESDGVTLANYWVERVSNGIEADVWVQVDALAADEVVRMFVYYDNPTATRAGDPATVFALAEDFESGSLASYSGDTGLFNVGGSFAYGGSFGLDTAGNENARATDGIGRTDITVSQGQTIRYMQYVDTTASGVNDEVCTLFAVQSPITANNNYAICVEQPGTDRISIVKDVSDTEFSGTILASSTATFSSGWYEFEIDWETDDTIDVTMRDASGTFVASTTATDSTYTSGGIGFTFWFQHGGWDSYVSWPRTETKPSTYLGSEQVDGGASWAAEQDVAGSGFVFGETARLRVGIDNTGLDITSQNFQLEFAPKLTAPSCEAVSPVSFVEVPNVASCALSEVCMATSSVVTNGDSTTDHLVNEVSQFVAGEIVTSPSNETTSYDLNQNRYTEIEYALSVTSNAANDAYCFKVTNDGADLDSYANLPELALAFDPVLDPVSLNDGVDIVLTAGTTTTITASTTVTDYNGVSDLAAATTTFFKTSVGAACTPDDNNCYISTSTCSFNSCTANSCVLQCTADFAYHTDPTDLDGGEEWFAFMEVSDLSGAADFGTSPAVEVLTLRAMDVQNAIGYGVVGINENTGSTNQDTNLLNLGNEPIDVQISGTDMTDGAASVIPAGQQLFSTSTFTYSSCVGCNTLTVTPATIEVDLAKPTTTSPAVSDAIYWGIEVPFGTASAEHTGTNFFTAIGD